MHTTLLQAYIKIAQAISSRSVSFDLFVTLFKHYLYFFSLFLVICDSSCMFFISTYVSASVGSPFWDISHWI